MTAIRPFSSADKLQINAWWESLTWVQKRRVMEICSRMSPMVLADSVEHARQIRGETAEEKP
jgi:hypothetical protein